jgi:hypothetical protein
MLQSGWAAPDHVGCIPCVVQGNCMLFRLLTSVANEQASVRRYSSTSLTTAWTREPCGQNRGVRTGIRVDAAAFEEFVSFRCDRPGLWYG